MSFITGKNVVVDFFDGGFWKTYACALNATFKISTDVIETSVKGTGKWKTFEPTDHTWGGTISGLVNLDMDNTLSYPDLQLKQINMELMRIRWQRTDDDSNVYTCEGYGYIIESSDEGPHDGMNSYSIELKGTGEITQVFTPTTTNPPGEVHRYEYTGTGGETFFANAALIGKVILEVVKDGVGFSKITTSGTPTEKEAKYTSGTGRIDVAVAFEAGEEAYVLYLDT